MSWDVSMSVNKGVTECTPALFHEVLAMERVGNVCAEIADGLEKVKRGEMSRDDWDEMKTEKKRSLPGFCFHAHFKNGRRKNSEAVPSGLSIYDIDHIPDPRTYFEQHVKDNVKKLRVVLAHITPSGEGLRLVFVIPQGKSLEEGQLDMSRKLNDQNYDAVVKDYARLSFAVPSDYVLYIDEKELFKNRKVKAVSKKTTKKPAQKKVQTATAETTSDEQNEAVSDRLLTIFDKCLAQTGLKLDNIDQWGQHDWHNTLLSILSVGLCRLMTSEEVMRVVSVRMPNYSQTDDCKNLVKYFYEHYTDNNRPMSQALRTIYRDTQQGQNETTGTSSNILGDEPPAMPEVLPPLIELLTSKVPEHCKPAVAMAVFAPLATHLKGVRFRYIDNVPHEATFMCCLMAKMSSGKSCVNEPINYIMRDIEERDEQARQREQQWKDTVKSKGANKDLPQRPSDLVIQILTSDMTNAALVQRLEDAGEHFIYTNMDEVELLNQLKAGARGSQVSQIIRLAFDCGYYGQERVGANSVTARVRVRWNWNASSTIQRGQYFFRNGLADGTLSRISFATIVPQNMGEIPVYGNYDEEFATQLKPYIDRLLEARGEIACEEASELARQISRENAIRAELSDDEIYEVLSYRANVIAYLRAMVLYVCNGCQWDDSFAAFVRWSENYDLWCKMHFFGDMMNAAMQKENVMGNHGPRNMLEMLPDRFTFEEVVAVRRTLGKTGRPINMVSMWKRRGYIIEDVENKVYMKSKYYLNKYKSV